jgi:hypothetical protein
VIVCCALCDFHSIKKVADFEEECMCIKFCFRLRKIAAETFRMLKLAFGGEMMSRIQTFDWFSKFKSEVTSADDAEYLGCPLTTKTDKNVVWIKELFHENSCIITV